MPTKKAARKPSSSPTGSSRAQTQKRGFGVTEFGLILILIIGTLIVWRQQRQIEQLAGTPPDAVEAVVEAPSTDGDTDTLTAPVTWEVTEAPAECGQAMQQLIAKDAAGNEQVIIASLQESLGMDEAQELSVVEAGDTSVLLAYTPCETVAVDAEPIPPGTAIRKGYARASLTGDGALELVSPSIALECPSGLDAVLESTEFTFCYPSSWGLTQVIRTVEDGEVHAGGTRATLGFNHMPLVSIEMTTPGYEMIGGTDYPSPPFHMSLVLSDDDIEKILNDRYGEVAELVRMKFDERDAVLARIMSPVYDDTFAPTEEEEPLNYLVIPNAMRRDGQAYDMLFLAHGIDETMTLDALIATLRFK
ncbi:MAG: hypothetical protein ABIG71_03760 [Candidatus Uhrbacteria bacterium]